MDSNSRYALAVDRLNALAIVARYLFEPGMIPAILLSIDMTNVNDSCER